ncbi:Yip1 family protein [Archaeoglobus fulgidus]|jgi:hypothetical protein|uniref:Yip1 domain-containing protein n=2 Tax=Archaeoglobus fulgidus TaxID=2234 RepID=A0A075WIB0_ARCFL|nr:YIP1 family protein [Archaeoglobus fulgidus]AAB90742.1 conserved hypothetical transmembrane protein [Archaeoglobus fulgidus DSM 4304]AIG97313.1 hypothetical protein AFULGI_00005050 [Archaeoglobus fulgidus DSM 8774]
MTLKLSQALPESLKSFFIAGAYIQLVSTFLGFFATWLIIAAVMHGLSAFFDGRGEFRRTFEFAGYGFMLSLLGSAVTIPVSLKYVEEATIPTIDLQELSANPEILVKSLVSHFPDSYVYSAIFLNLAVTAWSFLIWTFALKNARNVELKQAAVCAAIPTAIFGVYQVMALVRLLQ